MAEVQTEGDLGGARRKQVGLLGSIIINENIFTFSVYRSSVNIQSLQGLNRRK